MHESKALIGLEKQDGKEYVVFKIPVMDLTTKGGIFSLKYPAAEERSLTMKISMKIMTKALVKQKGLGRKSHPLSFLWQ